jgi:hypothetical protein
MITIEEALAPARIEEIFAVEMLPRLHKSKGIHLRREDATPDTSLNSQPLVFLKIQKIRVRNVLDTRKRRHQSGSQIMTYVMTKPCPVCKQQLTKQRPTDTVQCTCGKHVWQG